MLFCGQHFNKKGRSVIFYTTFASWKELKELKVNALFSVNSPVFRKKFVTLQRIVCHDDEMTLGSGSFSGISQQLLKRW